MRSGRLSAERVDNVNHNKNEQWMAAEKSICTSESFSFLSFLLPENDKAWRCSTGSSRSLSWLRKWKIHDKAYHNKKANKLHSQYPAFARIVPFDSALIVVSDIDRAFLILFFAGLDIFRNALIVVTDLNLFLKYSALLIRQCYCGAVGGEVMTIRWKLNKIGFEGSFRWEYFAGRSFESSSFVFHSAYFVGNF